MAGGGGGGPVAKVMGQIDAANAKSTNTGVDYAAPQTGPRYTPSYAPQNATPFLQNIMAQHGTPLQQGNSLGLPSLQSMFGMQQVNAPYQSGLQQLAPLTPYVGSTYRPNMSSAMARLNDVLPSVATEQARAAAAQAKWDAEHPVSSGDSGGGGGA